MDSHWKVFRTAGIILALGPIWGAIVKLVFTAKAIGEIQVDATVTEPALENISFAINCALAGWIACPIGIALIVLSLSMRGKAKSQTGDFPNKSMDCTSQ